MILRVWSQTKLDPKITTRAVLLLAELLSEELASKQCLELPGLGRLWTRMMKYSEAYRATPFYDCYRDRLYPAGRTIHVLPRPAFYFFASKEFNQRLLSIPYLNNVTPHKPKITPEAIQARLEALSRERYGVSS